MKRVNDNLRRLHSRRQTERRSILRSIALGNIKLQYREEFKNDKEFVLALCKKDPKSFNFCSERLRNDPDIVVATFKSLSSLPSSDSIDDFPILSKEVVANKNVCMAVCDRIDCLEFVPDEIRSGEDVLLKAMKAPKGFGIGTTHQAAATKEDNFEVLGLYAPKELFAKKSFMMEACKISGLAFQYATTDLRRDRQLVLTACHQNGKALRYAPKCFQADKEVVMVAVSSINSGDCALDHATADLQNDVEVIMTAIEKGNPSTLRYASPQIKSNRNIIISAVRKSGDVLQYVSDDLQDDIEVASIAIRNNAAALRYTSQNIRSNKHVVKIAVTKWGGALEYAYEDLKDDVDVVLTAIQDDAKCLQFASLDVRANENVVNVAITISGEALEYASDDLKNDVSIVKIAIANNARAIRHASDNIRGNKAVMMNALTQMPDTLQYASAELRDDEELVTELMSKQKEVVSLLPIVVYRQCKAPPKQSTVTYKTDRIAIKVGASIFHVKDNTSYDPVFKYASVRLKNKFDFVWKAVSFDDLALQHVPRALQEDADLVKAAFARREKKARISASLANWKIERESWMKGEEGRRGELATIDSDPKLKAKARNLWKELQGESLEAAIDSGAIAILDAAWLVEFCRFTTPFGVQVLPCRQHLPPEAFLSLDEIINATSTRPWESIHIVVLSYMWLHPDHPDPHGVTLKVVADALELMIRPLGVGPRRWGVLWDFASLYQHPNPKNGIYRTSEEQELFSKGLDSLAVFFSHQYTKGLRIVDQPSNYPKGYDLPEDANCERYENRGWPFVESCWMSLVKEVASQKVSYNTGGTAMGLPLPCGPTRDRQKELQEELDRKKGRFLTPEQMKEELESKSFTNAKSDKPLVYRLYRDFYENSLRKTKHIRPGGDRDVLKITSMIKLGVLPQLTSLSFEGCKQLFGEAECQALSDALSVENSSTQLTKLVLDKTNVGDAGVAILSHLLIRIPQLFMGQCMVGPKGCQALVDAASSCTSRKEVQWTQLGFNNNKGIENEGIQILCRIIRNIDINHINMTESILDNDGCEMLLNALIGDSTPGFPRRLETVNVYGCFIFEATDSFCDNICKLVIACPDLRAVRLGRMKKNSDFVDKILQCAPHFRWYPKFGELLVCQNKAVRHSCMQFGVTPI